MAPEKVDLDKITPIDEIKGSKDLIVRPTAYNLREFDRITANLQLYFEQDGEEPQHAAYTFSDGVPKSTEEPYVRRLKIGGKWVPLDLGWLADESIGMVVLANLIGRHDRVRPSPEELEARKRQIVRVREGDTGKGFTIRPGRFMVFEHADAASLFLKADEGTVKIQIMACPSGGA